MEFFANLTITIFAIMMGLFIVTTAHELGHYFVARVIMKEPNVKITLGFFGKPIINTKRLRINRLFFLGGFVGNYSDAEAKRSHMIMLFSSGAIFTILLGIPAALYVSSGSITFGDFVPFIAPSPHRYDLLSVPLQHSGFVFPWLSLATPLDFFNVFMLYIRMFIPWLILFAVLPYAYPLKLHGKLHWNPSDGLWVLLYAFNKVSEKMEENAMSAINEKSD